MSSPYVVRNEFSRYARNFQTEYALLPLEEKKKVKNTLSNVLVEPNQYKVVKNFKAGSIASGDKNKVVSNEIASIQSSNNKLYNTVYILTEALSSIYESAIRGSVIKAYDLIEKMLFLVLIKATIL